jgi:hypothetical protein
VVGVLVVTRLLFLTAFGFTGYPRLLLMSTTPIRPFTLQDSRFIGSNLYRQRLNTHHTQVTVGRSVSAQEPRLSPCTLMDATAQHSGRSFLRPKSEAVRQLTNPQKR